MSKNTRGACCGHTPGARRYFTAKIPTACACDCHRATETHPAYGPTPVQRPLWPRLDSGCAFGDTRQQVQCPLVIRTRFRGVARHAPTSRSRIGWFTTGAGR